MESNLAVTPFSPARSASSPTYTPQQTAWVAERLAAGELSKPGPTLDDFTRKLLLRLWLQTLTEIGEEAFDAALETVMHTSTFRPDIAEIRKAAGVNRGIVDPVEEEALAELGKVFQALRKFGPKLKPILGDVLNDGRDEQGLILQVPRRGPTTFPPAFSEATEAAIVAMGYGDRLAGLQALMAHPRMVTQDVEWQQGYSVRNELHVEKRWVAAYAKARAKNADSL